MTIGNRPHLFCFGLGYSARVLAVRLIREGWRISGTCRDAASQRELNAGGMQAFLFDSERAVAEGREALRCATDILSSVPPDADGDPVLRHYRADLLAIEGLRWIGYLSTTGVYGDTGGALVDESAPLHPTSERNRRRVSAEDEWLDLYREQGVPVHVFRLAGIYGPGRSVFDQVLAGTARRIDRPGHLFSRIHVDDIATVLRASMARPEPGRVYNVCDDVPATPAEVIAFACDLIGRPAPPLVPYAEAARSMSPMAQSFWRDNRRVDNRRMKRELGVRLVYPDYRSGLTALAAALGCDVGSRSEAAPKAPD